MHETLADLVDWLEGLGFVCYLAGNGAAPGSAAASLARLTGCWSPTLEYKHWSNVVCMRVPEGGGGHGNAVCCAGGCRLCCATQVAHPCTLSGRLHTTLRQVCMSRTHPLYPEAERMSTRYATYRREYYT